MIIRPMSLRGAAGDEAIPLPRLLRYCVVRNDSCKIVSKRGQSILEYALIISVVVASLVAMSIYVQRSAQANLKVIEDQINAQPNN